MAQPKKVLCIMDMTTVGRASLSVALPILSVGGAQCCPLPTAVFSTHTGGYTDVYHQDMADYGFKALAHFEKERQTFDVIYVGYLCSKAQFNLAQAAFDQYPKAIKVVDPALADDGALYAGLTQQTVDGMAALCQQADLITPNFTESAFLLGESNGLQDGEKTALARLEKLTQQARSVLITSVPSGEGTGVVGYDDSRGEHFVLPVHQLPQSYPGTGDIFTAVVVAVLLQGKTLHHAALKASQFVENAIRYTMQQKGEVRAGVMYEKCLPMLAQLNDSFI